MNDLNAPLTPPDCNLREYPFMPLEVKRLLSSETWILGTGEEKAAAITLWLESWHQIPAGSLPDDDRMLAHLSQAKNWKKVKAHSLRGWVKCSDGRLYHPVVAEKALEGWLGRLLSGLSGATGNAKRWGIEVDTNSIEDQIIEAVRLLENIAPRSEILMKKQVRDIVLRSGSDSPPDTKNIAPRSKKVSPPDSGCDRNREGDGEGEGNNKLIECVDTLQVVGTEKENSTHSTIKQNSKATDIAILMRGYGIRGAHPANPEIIAIADQDVDIETIRAALEEIKERKPDEAVSVSYVTKKLQGWAEKARQINVKGAKAPQAKTDNWFSSKEGIERKGRELGLTANAGEDYPSFKARIEREIERKAKEEAV